MAAHPEDDTAAIFTSGSVMRHVLTMTLTGSAGLMAIFLVDLANLFYISMLGEQVLAAAIGFAGTVMFFSVSTTIGIAIATAALVSRSLGAGDRDRARRLAGSALAFMVVFTALVAAALLPFLEPILRLLGATGRTLEVGKDFLTIVVPSMPLMGIGMGLSSVLRAAGDARRAMFVTLAGGLISALLDPLLIFGLDLGVTGAAIATVISRVGFMAVGWYGAVKIHDLVARPRLDHLVADFKPIFAIAGPAVLTNMATPVGNAYLTASIAPYGDSAVAGWAVVGRIIPVAFGGIFALSGSIGPIIGQNYGAKLFKRVKRTLIDSLIFMTAYTVIMWLILIAASSSIITYFGATGDGAALISFFCAFASLSFLFNGGIFVSNAVFNTLGYPLLSTLFNWGRATLGIIPFVWVGGQYWGLIGVMGGWAAGAVVFGLVAVATSFRVVVLVRLRKPRDTPPPVWRIALSAFTSGKGAAASWSIPDTHRRNRD